MLSEELIGRLREIVGEENVSTRAADLEAHAADESWVPPHPPDVVVWPSSTEEIAAIVCEANAHQLPIVPWSGGSSLEGNPVPVQGGILLALYRMSKVLEVREDDLQVVVQPGIIYDDLNAQLRRLGLFFPPAPGSSDVATIGGMVANNSSGMRAYKYGVTRDYVLKLVVVLPNGDVVHFGSNAKKSTSGYDLLGLFVGSEGTLGVATEITLRLAGLPEHTGVAMSAFETLEEAAAAIHECVRYGLEVSALEILDADVVRVTNSQQNLALPERPTLFVEFSGSETMVEEQIEEFREICAENGCLNFSEAVNAEERERLWTARREAHDSIKFANAGKTMIAGDVCVPISKFAALFPAIAEVGKRQRVDIYTFGHAGDGNLHTEIIADREDADEFARALEATAEIVRLGLEVGGTVSGEHGIGVAKREFMAQEHGQALEIMRAIKYLFDPQGIMNPGKILPPA